jgi:hypothetical protein
MDTDDYVGLAGFFKQFAKEVLVFVLLCEKRWEGEVCDEGLGQVLAQVQGF